MGKRTLKPAAPAPDLDDLDELDGDDLDRENTAESNDDDDDDLWDSEDDGHEPTDLEGRLDQALEGPLDDDEMAIAACKYCGCTEATACNTPGGPCAWIPGDEPVCDNPECLRKYLADGGALSDELLERADPGESIEETEPPIVEREASGERAPADLGEIEPIAIVRIDADPDQPRLDVDDELAASIAAQGVLQPIVVRPKGDGTRFIIVDGERRYRGALKAGFAFMPARVVHDLEDAGDRLLRQVTLNEGKRLAPMEEAKAWKRIMDAKGWNIQQLAIALGRAKSTVSDRLALLDAPAPFQELFAKGQLSAAAAPIAREYREIPERILKDVVKDLLDDEYEGWGRFTENGVPVPVEIVKELLENELTPKYGLGRLAPIDKKLEKEYSGGVATIKGKKYAVDAEAYRALEQSHRAKASVSGAGTYVESASERRYREEAAERQRKERQAHEKKRARRRAQFDAIAPKVPSTLDGNWALLLVTWLTKEIQQDFQRIFLKALGVEPTKGKGQYGGYDFQGTIIREAEKLAAPARVKFALTLLLAHDLQVSPYDMGPAARFTAAAKLLKIDLAKVKVPDASSKKSPAKKAAKKGGRR